MRRRVNRRPKQKKIVAFWPVALSCKRTLNRTMMKTVKAANLEGRDLSECLDEWLMAYRHTKHPATGMSPVAALATRSFCDGIPALGDIIIEDTEHQ